MKHLIFEGIDCAGKTTTIQRLSDTLSTQGISTKCIDEISDSPIFQVQQDIFQKDPFFRLNMPFKTSIFETLLLASDAIYRQEKMFYESTKDTVNGVYLYDRDIPSVLTYQSIILQQTYPEKAEELINSLSNILYVNRAKYDGIVFLDVPLKTVYERTAQRENRQLSDSQVQFLQNVQQLFNKYINMSSTNILKLSGLDDIDQNVRRIIQTFGLVKKR